MIISYQFLLLFLAPVFFWLSIRHAVNHKNTLFLWQRLGMNLPAIENPVWFHCASVGEVITAVPLITLYHKQFPEQSILLTTNTITGASICKQKLPFASHSFLPLDYRLITRLFLNKIKPQKLIIMETELWPNLLQLCRLKKIPVNIINGRLSQRSLNINSWSKSVYKTTLSHVDKIYCRSDSDADAYQSLGATDQQTETVGNLKFSAELDLPAADNLIGRPYVLAASTHAGEEKIIVELWNKTNHDNLLLVIAPRHPERKNDILTDIAVLTRDVKVRSLQQDITDDTSVYLADTLGELPALFQHAEFIIMGGSFVAKGGHNILEPAALSKAITYGPSMENFAAEDLLFRKNNAAIQITADQQSVETINRVISDTDFRQTLAKNALSVMQRNNNIADIYLQKIMQ
ncbi:MAG: 3-deoxy-D-manno-octulosonic acid transferase [Gammaproteobacteria bacterium]|nr:3-deoxy-D-manno-octulosonic acid transferase [Gammaproteobacteria bacterium]